MEDSQHIIEDLNRHLLSLQLMEPFSLNCIVYSRKQVNHTVAKELEQLVRCINLIWINPGIGSHHFIGLSGNEYQ